jgi:folate-dependent phosphoribosylglycinamide formyltransferase PurN
MRVAVLAPSPWSETSIAMSAHLAATGYTPVGAISLPTWHWKTIRRKSSQWGRYDFGRYVVRKIVSGKKQAAVLTTSLLRFVPPNARVVRSLYETAESYGFPILISRDLNSEECIQQVRDWKVDLLVYTGGGILREGLIRAPRLGVLNAHDALLPEIRGMAGPEWSLLLGIPVGVTVIFVDKGIDTGHILIRRQLPMAEPPTSFEALRNHLAAFEVSLIAEAVAGLDRGTLKPLPQPPTTDQQYYVMHEALKAIAERKLAGCSIGARRDGNPTALLSPMLAAAAGARERPFLAKAAGLSARPNSLDS